MARTLAEVDDATSVGQLLRSLALVPMPDDQISVNSIEADADQMLKNNDVVVMVRPIVGASVLLPGARHEGINTLREFSRDAKTLMILDPYIYQCGAGAEDIYVAQFAKATAIDVSPRNVTLVHGPRNVNAKAWKEVQVT